MSWKRFSQHHGKNLKGSQRGREEPEGEGRVVWEWKYSRKEDDWLEMPAFCCWVWVSLWWSLGPSKVGNCLAAGAGGLLLWRCPRRSVKRASLSWLFHSGGVVRRGLVSFGGVRSQSFSPGNGEQRRMCGMMLASHLHAGSQSDFGVPWPLCTWGPLELYGADWNSH